MNTMNHKLFKFALALSFAMGSGTWQALATSPNATNNTVVIADATIQYPNATNVPPAPLTSFTNYQSGYNKIKFGSGTNTGQGLPCKTYFKFDFNGVSPNTNYLLKFSVPAVVNNGQTHCMIWCLNQSYAGFTTNGNATTGPGLSWWSAQANYTNTFETTYNSLMTSGLSTAALAGDFIAPGGNSATIGFTIPAPWGQYLINDAVTGHPCLVFALTATNDPANSGNGGRWTLHGMNAFYQPLTPGTQPPKFNTTIADQTVTSGSPSPAIGFTVIDPADAANTLTNFSIALGNTNISMTATNFINANDGSGNCTLTFTPNNNLAGGKTANATVTVVLTDNAGNSASTTFNLTVPPMQTYPVVLSGTNVNFIPAAYTTNNAPVTITFQVVETNANVAGYAGSLIVTGQVASYTTTLSPTLSFTHTGGATKTNNCSVTITPTGRGVGIVNLSIIDPTNNFTNVIGLAVMNVPAASYVFCDLLAYQASSAYSGTGQIDLLATNVSMGMWSVRAANSTKLMSSVPSVTYGVSGGMALIRSSAFSESGQSRLLGAPYRANSHAVLYATFNATWLDISLLGGTAYYPGTSAGGFVQFAADASGAGATMAGVCTTITNYNTNPDPQNGFFQLCLYDYNNNPVVNTSGSGSPPPSSIFIPNLGVNEITGVQKVAVAYDTDTGISTLWINPTTPDSTDSSGVSCQDNATTNLQNVSYIVLRQNTGMGAILVSNLQVQVVYKQPVIKGITIPSGGQVHIYFTTSPGLSGSLSIVGAPTVNGTYAAVGGVSISESTPGNYDATVPVSGSQYFYRASQTGVPTVTFPF